MRWHVLGAGAVGGLFATRLLRAGCNVTLLLRNQQGLDQFHAQGESLSLQSGPVHRTFALQGELFNAPGPIDHLLVTTKAWATAEAMAAIEARLHESTQILLLQNGCGQQQALAARRPKQPIWAGVTTSGVRPVRRPFSCCWPGEGETTLGPLTPAAQGFPSGWEGLEHPLHYTADIDRALWCKLAINGVINPLTALENCSNGALLEPRHGPILESLCAEIEAIARAAGHPLFAQPLIHQVKQVAASTAANRSSMLEDISAGRPTEIDQITGYLCRVADARGVAAPLNRQLLQEIHRLEGTHSPQPEEHP